MRSISQGSILGKDRLILRQDLTKHLIHHSNLCILVKGIMWVHYFHKCVFVKKIIDKYFEHDAQKLWG